MWSRSGVKLPIVLSNKDYCAQMIWGILFLFNYIYC